MMNVNVLLSLTYDLMTSQSQELWELLRYLALLCRYQIRLE